MLQQPPMMSSDDDFCCSRRNSFYSGAILYTVLPYPNGQSLLLALNEIISLSDASKLIRQQLNNNCYGLVVLKLYCENITALWLTILQIA